MEATAATEMEKKCPGGRQGGRINHGRCDYSHSQQGAGDCSHWSFNLGHFGGMFFVLETQLNSLESLSPG